VSKLHEIKKALVAGGGVLGIVLAQALQAGNVIPDKYASYATLLLGVLTVAGVYQTKNAPPAPSPAHEVGDAGAGEVGIVLIAAAVSIVVLALAVALHLI